MQTQPDISTLELMRTQLRLRSDLRFIPQRYGAETWYHVEVTGSGEYYRIGYAEYCFVSLLDGQTSFAQALAASAQVLGTSALSRHQAETVYVWLLDRKLGSLTGDMSPMNGCGEPSGATQRRQNLLSRMNPLWIRIPLGRPQAFLRTLQPWLGWLFSGPATLTGLATMLLAVAMISTQWSRFALASETVFAPHNWLWLLLAWMALKLIHEIAHGLVCLRYGGEIRGMGIVLALLAPLAWVDATSCWSFHRRRHRIHVAMAGVYVELLIASLAAVWWSQTESRELSHLLYSVIVMASLSTLIFNLNPLMRFDGYFVLSDILNIPNLYAESGTVLTDTFRWLVFGDARATVSIAGQRRYVLLVYGAAALLWRLSVCMTLLIAASVMFHGAGIALAVGGFVAWFATPLWRSCGVVRSMTRQAPARLLRGAVVVGGVGSIVIALLWIVPAPFMKTAPGIVDYDNGQVVRALTSGFVKSIEVRDGDDVSAGDLLVELTNDEFESELADLMLQLAQEKLRLQTATRNHDAAGISIARANLNSLQHRQTQSRKQVDGLRLIATANGRVSSRQLSQLQGTFVKAGDELLTIGRENEKQVKCSVGQLDLHSALQRSDQSVAIRVGTRPIIYGSLQRVDPRATRNVLHPALAATSGGSLAVVDDHESVTAGEVSGRMRLTEHRFDGVIQLAAQDARQLHCGERCVVSLGRPQVPLALHLYYGARGWLRTRLQTELTAQ